MRIAALATGVGNVRSVVRALARSVPVGRTIVTADPDEVRRADVLVVPGQGSFGAFAAALDAAGLREAIGDKVRSGAPYLGICLGLQVLFDESDEAPGARGLGVFRGRVRRLAPGADAPLPHMGWNRAERAKPSAVLESAHYYFAHTYAAAPADASIVLATTTYGGETFASAIEDGAIVGVQFHPEKSQRAGLDLVERFFRTL
ncbi:MAG: imidazole glycerol phosphate synthase subunit HisH [Labilithrix sp.]|nr:imidazole glycerol phosphate synthase subunit HisH [Labilithrix sp.]MCW5813658.1 imidazole glycerol phosphate synthase subunit HisH [Labilithrix sp.]